MTRDNLSPTQLSRQVKDTILRGYYTFRIQSTSEPNRLAFSKTPYRILLILSHMRSGSSLLTHLLVNHGEIAGYGETHLSYCSERDFKPLLLKVYWAVRGFRMNHAYILDKVLHNQRIQTTQILQADYVRVIFLIRQPEETIESLLRLKSHWHEQDALHYYTERLAALEAYAQAMNDRQKSFLLSYETLINQSPAALLAMQRFLELRSPLSEEYRLTRQTGLRGIGDSSEKIKSGRIIRSHQPSIFKLADAHAEAATTAFERCRSTLSRYCQTVRSTTPLG